MDRRRQGVFWLGTAVLAGAITAVAGLSADADKPPLVNALVWTGRLAFAVFLIPLFASPLRELARTPFTLQLMQWRRNAGIVYGGVQGVHLVLIAMMFASMANPPVEIAMVIVGGAGLGLAMGMLWTSFDGPLRWLGLRRWRQLHRTGFHVFMVIYVYDFVVEPLTLGSFHDTAVYALLTLLGMFLRTVTWMKPLWARAA